MTFGDRLKQWLTAHGGPEATLASVGATPIASCVPRTRVRVAGVVRRTGVDERTGWFEAELRDATGSVTLLWMGRAGITSLVEGSIVVASGRLAERGGVPVLYNPAFSVLP